MLVNSFARMTDPKVTLMLKPMSPVSFKFDHDVRHLRNVCQLCLTRPFPLLALQARESFQSSGGKWKSDPTQAIQSDNQSINAPVSVDGS